MPKRRIVLLALAAVQVRPSLAAPTFRLPGQGSFEHALEQGVSSSSHPPLLEDHSSLPSSTFSLHSGGTLGSPAHFHPTSEAQGAQESITTAEALKAERRRESKRATWQRMRQRNKLEAQGLESPPRLKLGRPRREIQTEGELSKEDKRLLRLRMKRDGLIEPLANGRPPRIIDETQPLSYADRKVLNQRRATARKKALANGFPPPPPAVKGRPRKAQSSQSAADATSSQGRPLSGGMSQPQYITPDHHIVEVAGSQPRQERDFDLNVALHDLPWAHPSP